MEVEGRARAERTENINAMLVTLDVSKLSGWLNAYARCRIEKGKHRRRGDMRASGREDGAGWPVAQAAGMPGLWRLRAGNARSAPQTWTACL